MIEIINICKYCPYNLLRGEILRKTNETPTSCREKRSSMGPPQIDFINGRKTPPPTPHPLVNTSGVINKIKQTATRVSEGNNHKLFSKIPTSSCVI